MIDDDVIRPFRSSWVNDLLTARFGTVGTPGIGEGTIRFYGKHQGWMDKYDGSSTAPNAETFAAYNERFEYMQVYGAGTYWMGLRDESYPRGLLYKDSHGVKSSYANLYPYRLVDDATGSTELRLNYNSSTAGYDQYVGDISSAAFRSAWIAELTAAFNSTVLAGVWVDDVNMRLNFVRVVNTPTHATQNWSSTITYAQNDRIGYKPSGQSHGRVFESINSGNTNHTPPSTDVSDAYWTFIGPWTVNGTPRNPDTGVAYTESQWREHMAEFMEDIRAAFPTRVIAHNALFWLSGTLTDPFIQRQIEACDYYNIERAINDSGFTTSDDFDDYLAFVDYAHSLGRSVIHMDYTSDAGRRDYALATYLLTADGTDMYSNDKEVFAAPTTAHGYTWHAGFSRNLGAALGEREPITGGFRREFQFGYVEVQVPPVYTGEIVVTGNIVPIRSGSVTLASGTAAVTLSPAEPDTDYRLALSGNANETFRWASKATGGFTINSSNGSSTATVDWLLSR